MLIGTMRLEEARVFDGDAGYHQFTSEDGESHGSFEVFWHDGPEPIGWLAGCDEDDDWREWSDGDRGGWYWAAGFPGCTWDGDPCGPFATSTLAREDADPEGDHEGWAS